MLEIFRNGNPQKVLIVGGGGREHALGWRIAKDEPGTQLEFAPGNAGTQELGRNVDIDPSDVDRLVNHAVDNRLNMVVVGSEDPLGRGLINALQEANGRILGFGPTQEAAQLETDKYFATRFMDRHNIPHPKTSAATDPETALGIVRSYSLGDSHPKVVIKVNGPAGGKGVFIPESYEEAEEAINLIMINRKFGAAGDKVIIQERLFGVEVSAIAFVSNIVKLLPLARDYKRSFDGDLGPNTGGMGAFAPSNELTQEDVDEIVEKILIPTRRGMGKDGIPFKGVLYAGIMMTRKGPFVLEYNVRFGDPETQVQLRLVSENIAELMRRTVHGTLSNGEVKTRNQHAVGVVLASEGYPGNHETGKKISGLDRLGKEVVVFHSGTERRGNEIETSGGRVLTVTATGKSKGEARQKAYEASGKILFEGKQMRRDIGA